MMLHWLLLRRVITQKNIIGCNVYSDTDRFFIGNNLLIKLSIKTVALDTRTLSLTTYPRILREIFCQYCAI
jgi:hypothetical protein